LCKDIASLRGFIEALQTILPTIISITIFGLAVAVGQELNAANVFTVLTLLNMLQLPIRMLISTYSALLSAFVSFERIESFLNAEEKQETDELQDDIYSLKTENAHLAWDSVNAKQQFELKAHLFSAQAVKPAKVRDKQYLELPTSTNLSP
jgi:ABC-type multidrug transport system fused ATPase/permease subunit